MSTQRIPVIIDCDPGVDDTLAILLALSSPELEVLGYVVSYGNTDREASVHNIRKIYGALARHFEKHPEHKQRYVNVSGADERPFLVRGPSGPLDGELHSAQYFHGRDGLGGITQRHPDLTEYPLEEGKTDSHLREINQPAEDVALEIIKSQPPRSVTYLVLGPMTNLALMMRKDPATVKEHIGRVICMGGALDVPGNTSPVAEFNFFADPYAVHELLTSPSPFPHNRFLLLPLDITTPHELTFAQYLTHIDPHLLSTTRPSNSSLKSPLCHFTTAFLERTREIMLSYGKDAVELHDIVAVWCAIQNPPVSDEQQATHGPIPVLSPAWSAKQRLFGVERLGELTRGMLIIDRRGKVDAHGEGINRAEVQAKLEQSANISSLDTADHTLPAPMPESGPSNSHVEETGVAVITRTPGPKALVELMFSRIWGVDTKL